LTFSPIPRRVTAAGIAAALLLAGCTSYQPKPISAETSAADFTRRNLDNPGLKQFVQSNDPTLSTGWPPSTWGLRDLTLAAFYYHPSLDVARAEWASARARGITAGQRRNPDLNLTPGYNTTRSIPSAWLPLAFLDIPIETAGKRGHRIARAAQLSEAARLNVASVAWQVRSRLRNSLAALDAARETQGLLQGLQANHAENLTLLQRQFDVGAISAFELTQARIAANAAEFALHDAERQSAEALVQVAEALGLPADALSGVRISFDDLDRLPEEASLADARRQALSNRPDILVSLAEYAASEASLQLEIARQYPDIRLLPGYQYDQGADKWTLGITVTLPMMNRNKGGIAEASAAREEAAARFNLLQSQVIAAIDGALAGYRAAMATRSAAETSLSQRQEQEKTSQAMLEAGEISRSQLIAMRLELSASALTRLGAIVRVREALGKLEDALQSPLGLPLTAWQVDPRAAPAVTSEVHP
jgi:outer membrane protein, heavy metal efflux system